ncbi:MAG: non-homologous end-joining DNA ligase, partial [Longimicrobiales bacterium]
LWPACRGQHSGSGRNRKTGWWSALACRQLSDGSALAETPLTRFQIVARTNQRVEISHPEKVLFPDDGITKGDLAAYYEAVAPVMVPHMKARPVTMERYHRGISEEGFFQKDVSKGFPEWLKRVTVPKKDGTVHHPIVTDTRSLLWLANQNCITPHVWVTRAPDLVHPDICVFDLDPLQDQPDVLRAAALGLRDLLDELGLPSWIKTTGSKGFHIAVPLDGKADSGAVSRFADRVGTLLVVRDPEHLTQEFSKADRGGRILVDTGRNHYGATFAATYAVRAKAGAPVSAPCTWEEVESGEVGPQTFTLRNMEERLAAVGDLWADMRRRKRSLTRPIQRLKGMVE